jgi:Rrf2 family protein
VRQDDGPVKAEAIATEQDIPHKFLEGILGDLRRAGLVDSRRGGNGGYRLVRDASAITVADVIRAVDGPIVSVRGVRPTGLTYAGSTEPLLPLWIALRANVRRILEGVTVADIATGALPENVQLPAAEPAAWENPAKPSQLALSWLPWRPDPCARWYCSPSRAWAPGSRTAASAWPTASPRPRCCRPWAPTRPPPRPPSTSPRTAPP